LLQHYLLRSFGRAWRYSQAFWRALRNWKAQDCLDSRILTTRFVTQSTCLPVLQSGHTTCDILAAAHTARPMVPMCRHYEGVSFGHAWTSCTTGRKTFKWKRCAWDVPCPKPCAKGSCLMTVSFFIAFVSISYYHFLAFMPIGESWVEDRGMPDARA
jgi:hypothetical protein